MLILKLDIDGDGESKPLTDGLLLIRYLFGFSGDSLISGAIGSGAERDTAEEVEAYIQGACACSVVCRQVLETRRNA